MEIAESREGGALILEPSGRLDKKSSQEFQNKVVEFLDGGDRRIVIDLGAIEQVDGAGLRALLTLNRKLDSMEGRLVLCSLRDQVRKAFHLGGLLQMFSIEASRGDAMQEVAGEPALAKIADLAVKLLIRAEERAAARRGG